MSHEFCGIFLLRRRLFLVREEGVGGPRRMLLPPRELSVAVDPGILGEEIAAALSDYRDTKKTLSPGEWEQQNRSLLELMGEKSVASFERNKRDVTIRRDRITQEVVLFSPKSEQISLSAPSASVLGEAVKSLLRL